MKIFCSFLTWEWQNLVEEEWELQKWLKLKLKVKARIMRKNRKLRIKFTLSFSWAWRIVLPIRDKMKGDFACFLDFASRITFWARVFGDDNSMFPHVPVVRTIPVKRWSCRSLEYVLVCIHQKSPGWVRMMAHFR